MSTWGDKRDADVNYISWTRMPSLLLRKRFAFFIITLTLSYGIPGGFCVGTLKLSKALTIMYIMSLLCLAHCNYAEKPDNISLYVGQTAFWLCQGLHLSSYHDARQNYLREEYSKEFAFMFGSLMWAKEPQGYMNKLRYRFFCSRHYRIFSNYNC